MRIVEIEAIELPDLPTYRSVRRISCQEGQLGLIIDIAELPNTKNISVSVGYYTPATSGGYHRLYCEGEQLIHNQVNSLIEETLLQLIDLLDLPLSAITILGNNGFIAATGIDTAASRFGFERERN